MANAKALLPFGFRPLSQQPHQSKQVILAATHVAFGVGHPIRMAADGCVPHATDTASEQIGLVGISAEPKDANTGGALMVYPIQNGEKFLVQSTLDASNFASEAVAYGQSYALEGCDVARDTETLRSKVGLGAEDGTNGAVIIEELPNLPGNLLADSLTATEEAATFPLFVVSFLARAIATSDVS